MLMEDWNRNIQERRHRVMSSRIVHFEIHAADAERVMKFYEDVFGREFPKWMDDPPYGEL